MPPSIEWVVISLYSDVVITKGVPVPYALMSKPQVAELASKDVAANGMCVMNIDSICTTCTGDEAGDAGIKSGTILGLCEPVPKVCNVHVNSSPILHEGDLVFMNLQNTIGMVMVFPAVDNPSDPHNLDDAEFDAAVAELICKTLNDADGDIDKAQGILTGMRNPRSSNAPNASSTVYNNPVVVAAEYFFVTAGNAMGTANKVTVLLWQGSKLIPGDPLEPARDFLTGGSTNTSQQAYEFDSRVTKWGLRGTDFRGKGKLACSAVRELNAKPDHSSGTATSPYLIDLKRINEQRASKGLPPVLP